MKKILGILAVAFLIILSFFVGRSSKETKPILQISKETTSPVEQQASPNQKQSFPTEKVAVKGEITRRGTVKYVIDGDTIELENGEWVEIKNTGSSTVNMDGWTLKDEANHLYTFTNFSLAPNASVFLYSGAGNDNQNKLYWDSSKHAIWNNTGDTAFLRDASGNLVDSYKY